MAASDLPPIDPTKPRLLFYTHALVGGGAERVWAQLAAAFRSRGYETLFVVDREADAWRSLLGDGVPLVILATGHRGSVRDLARVLAETRPAVALSAVGGSNLKLVAAERIAKSGAKLVISYHGFSEWRTGKLGFATYLTLPWLSRTTARTIAVSNGLRRLLVTRWLASAKRTVAIPNPVQLPEALTVAGSEAELLRRQPIVVSVGRLVPEKDYPTLLRAFARLLVMGTAPDARLVILGEGPERGNLEAIARDLGITERLAMPGHRPPWPELANARCFALSSWSEAFGNVVVEALAHGLPVVATRSGGPEEILDGGRLGALVGSGDADAFARALANALQSPGPPQPRIERAATFSFDRGFAAYARMIDDVAGEAAAPLEAPPTATTTRA